MSTTAISTTVSSAVQPKVEALMSILQSQLGSEPMEPSKIEQLRELAEKTITEQTQKNKKTTKIPTTREIPTNELRCQARTWGNTQVTRGTGPRCVHKLVPGCNGLCTGCFKKEQECATPCTLVPHPNKPGKQKKHGLFWGRAVDNEGNPLPHQWRSPEGEVAIIWVGVPDVKKEAEAAIRSGVKFLGGAPYLNQVTKDLGGIPKSKNTVPRIKKDSSTNNSSKPKRVQNAYLRFLSANRDRIKAELLEKASAENENEAFTVSVKDVTKEAGNQWKALSEEQRRPYVEAYLQAKELAAATTEAATTEVATTEVATTEIHSQESNSTEIAAENSQDTGEKNEETDGDSSTEQTDASDGSVEEPVTFESTAAALVDELLESNTEKSNEKLPTSSEIDGMRVVDLREFCQKYSLPTDGKKAILVDRVREYVASAENVTTQPTSDDDEEEAGEDEQEEEDELEEEDANVIEHTLDDGTEILLDEDDGGIYSVDECEYLGQWEKSSNTMVPV